MRVVLGLGSNLPTAAGDELGYLRRAIRMMRSAWTKSQFKIELISPLYESDALLPQGAPSSWDLPFFNLCVLGKTELEPAELLNLIKRLEANLGRQRRERWAPREIDVDILAIEGVDVSQDDLQIPHPGLFERPFAYLPFLDLAPDWGFVRRFGRSHGPVPFETRRSPRVLTEWVGILNITPDSFSDGGLYLEPSVALSQARDLVHAGARVMDIGAESTRPGAPEISWNEEWRRLEPILRALRDQGTGGALLSIDSRHPEVAAKALDLGVSWLNDVSGFSNPKMLELAAASSADLVFMHSLCVPANPAVLLPPECDAVQVVYDWASQRISEFLRAGVSKDRLIFDPGLGFGKTVEQNWDLIRQARVFHDLGVRILYGHSRKSFFKSITNAPAPERDWETASVSQVLAQQGVDYLRVHDPAVNHRVLRAWAMGDGVVQVG